jgi:para-aminobenzoate synthetase/4-amino-4-deoxychorismate lyase
VKDFALIETMRVGESGDVYLLERHLERLSRSARFFSFPCNVSEICETIAQTVSGNPRPACLRLTLSPGGECRLQPRPLPGPYVQRLRLATLRVSSTDVFLYHKTTNRSVY